MGENNFIAVQASGKFFLFNQEDDQIKVKFDPVQTGVSRICWKDRVSGEFLVASPKTGILKLYKAAMPTPKEVIKVSRFGIKDITPTRKAGRFLIKLTSGEIVYFNIVTKKVLYSTDIGHISQI